MLFKAGQPHYGTIPKPTSVNHLLRKVSINPYLNVLLEYIIRTSGNLFISKIIIVSIARRTW